MNVYLYCVDHRPTTAIVTSGLLTLYTIIGACLSRLLTNPSNHLLIYLIVGAVLLFVIHLLLSHLDIITNMLARRLFREILKNSDKTTTVERLSTSVDNLLQWLKTSYPRYAYKIIAIKLIKLSQSQTLSGVSRNV